MDKDIRQMIKKYYEGEEEEEEKNAALKMKGFLCFIVIIHFIYEDWMG